jgi:hypothetical protein
MHRFLRKKFFALFLIPILVQTGMAQWTPHFDTDMTRDSDIASTHSDSEHGDPAHDSLLPDKKAGAPPEAGYGEHCQQPSIGCDCPGCLGYFDAHSLTLPIIVVTPLQVPESDVYESDMIALLGYLSFAPPTPPPRS